MARKFQFYFIFLFLMFSFLLFPKEVNALDNTSYALVNFHTKSCSSNTYYTDFYTGRSGYTNGCYGADGAFLGYNDDMTQVKFMLGGVTGWVNASEVEVLEMNDTTYNIYYTTFYRVRNQELQHCIYSNVQNAQPTCIIIDRKPSYLSDDPSIVYFSYDGHYFYQESLAGYKQMIDDYRNGTREHSVNSNSPYYNYYQYLSHRTISNYTSDNFNQYVTEKGFTSKPINGVLSSNTQSQLYNEGVSFVQYQSEFGANAGLVFGVGINESGWGTSPISVSANNIFGHSAYDSAPGANASSYISVAQGIYAHTKVYVSEGFMDPCDGFNTNQNGYQSSICLRGRYYGSHLGNKNSGMNVKYASDPFWGEKAAANYYLFDKRYGYQDYGKYKVGIKTTNSNYAVRKEPSSSSTLLYETGTFIDVPFVILGSVTGESVNGSDVWYKVQTDPVMDANRNVLVQIDGYYNYANNYGYIHSSAISTIVSDGVTLRNLYTITFDPNGGTFTDGVTGRKYLTVEEYVIPEIHAPSKAGYDFIGWSSEVVGATGNVTYVAQYKSLVTSYEITFDPNGGTFSDGTTGKKVISVDKGVIPSVANPTRSGYDFAGWSPKVVAASGNTSYQAIWTEKKKYEITFDANGGLFSDQSEIKKLQVIEGELPSITSPEKKGYIFVGWDSTIVSVSKSVTYTAVWEKGVIEELFEKKNGEFYLHEFTWNNETKQYTFSGYMILLGVNNSKDSNLTYDLILKDKNSEKEYSISIDRWFEQVPYDLGYEGSLDYRFAWFKGNFNFNEYPSGDYDLYMRVYDDKYYAREVVNNLFNKGIARRTETDKMGSSIKVMLNRVNKKLELSLRSEGLITTSEAPTYHNMTNDYVDMYFKDSKFYLTGTSFNYSGVYSKASDVKRTLIIENTSSFKQYTYDLNAVKYPSSIGYQVNVGDGASKDYAWYNTLMDITNIKEEGTYSFYVYTKTSNAEDYGEIVDLFGSIYEAKMSKDGYTYQLSLNKNRNNRIELKVTKG